MITMKNWASKAVKKLTDGKKAVSGQKQKAMASAVCAALKDFCLQNEEFAQAVVEGGSLADCMNAVESGVGNSISDLDAYKKAVNFFFAGARIKMQMTIDLIGNAAGHSAQVNEDQPIMGLILDLTDIL